MTIETAILIETLVELGAIGALGQLQYFLHAGPRRRRHRQGRHPGLRLERRNAGRILGLHPRRADASRRQRPATHRGRRRRRHACSSTKATNWKTASDWVNTPSDSHEVARHQESAQARREGTPRFLARRRERLERRFRRNHHRRASSLPDAGSRANCSSPPSTSTTPSPNPNSTIFTAAANRSPTASSARPT